MISSSGAQGAPTGDGTAWPDDAVEVGRIVDAWGIKGWIKVLPFAKDPQALFSSKRWYLKEPEPRPGQPKPAGPAASYPSLLKIVEAKEHGEVVVAQVRDIPDRNGAEALIGCRIFIPRSSFPTPDDGEYYWTDLIGMSVVNRQSEALGTVAGLIDTGPHSVLQVVPDDAAAPERLIPFVSAYVDDVSVEQRRITVDWGLDY